MCILNPSESGHGGKFIPCQMYNELLEKYNKLKYDYNEPIEDRIREEWEYVNEIPDGGNS